MKVLAVIPVRGGSKGIPRKNARLIGGKPLIAYAIENALACRGITDVAVTSDDEELLAISEMYGAQTVVRRAELAQDHITLDPVIYDAVIQMEEINSCKYDVVITMQATSPTLSASTLEKALNDFISSDFDTYISAVNKPHLAWTRRDGECVPLYEKRLNRQQLPPNYVEAGAFLIARRDSVTENGRIGKKTSVYEIPEAESIDIDSMTDWVACECLLSSKKIILRCDGYKEIGMGHIYHCLTLYYNLMGHDVLFVTKHNTMGAEKLRSCNVNVREIDSDEEFFGIIKEFSPDIIVNDCLDTEAEYVKNLKLLAPRVVSIEDLGDGAAYADCVINALYEGVAGSGPNVFSGEKYVCLRDEFLYTAPKGFDRQVNSIVVMFGGTDPSNLTLKAYKVAKQIISKYPNIAFTFVTGMGYDTKLHGIESVERIKVLNNVSFLSRILREADIAVTSQGRTVYEIAAMGVPAIVMSQNSREQMHTFAQMANGFVNLGLGTAIEADTLEKTLEWLIDTPQIREEMRTLMLSHELKNGVKREIRLILGE